jgi:hypothetical protein
VLHEAGRITAGSALSRDKVQALISVLPQLATLDRERALPGFERAIELANGIKIWGPSKAQVLGKIAGQLAKVDRNRALRVFDDAFVQVESLRGQKNAVWGPSAALITIVTEMAKVDLDRALKVAK